MTNTTKIDADDWRLTAYALGELQGEERLEVEAAIKSDPALVQAVAKIQRTAGRIEAGLKQEAAPVELDAERREAALAGKAAKAAPAGAKAGKVVPLSPARWSAWLKPAAAAAVVLIGAGVVLVPAGMRTKDAAYAPHASRTVDMELFGPAGTAGAPPDATQAPGTTGDRYFVVNEAGVVYYDAQTGAATTTPADGTRLLPVGKGGDEAQAPPTPPRAHPATERPPTTEARPGTSLPPATTQPGKTPAPARPAHEPPPPSTGAPIPVSDPAALAAGARRATDEQEELLAVIDREVARGDVDKAREQLDRLERRQQELRGLADRKEKDARARGDEQGRREAEAEKKELARLDVERDRLAKAAETAATVHTAGVYENPFVAASVEATSTFSIDVDTAAYAGVRRMLQHHQRPDPESVRLEELVNYFPYDYAAPTDGRPFAAHVEVTASPWKAGNRLVRVGLKGKELAQRPRSNLVFLIDVSGSMNEPQKLPLLKRSLAALVDQLREQDRVSIVVYAGASGLVLPPTTGDRKAAILEAIERLDAGGSTNGGAGMGLAYKVAVQNFVEGGVNRVLLCTDGDWNVGISSKDAIEKLVVEKARSGVFLTCLGFFGSNYKDALMERMADKGNGNYAAIDSLREAKKVLVEESAGTLCTIAKDVKIQVEFSKERVARYRLVGYENRVMANRDFRDDTKDAGEIGAGHTVTALYEVEPVQGAPAGDLLTLRLRWKKPDGDVAEEQEQKVVDDGRSFGSASVDTRFAAVVAGWGMLLRGSQHKGTASFAMLEELGADALGKDAAGHRREWLELLRRSKELYGGR